MKKIRLNNDIEMAFTQFLVIACIFCFLLIIFMTNESNNVRAEAYLETQYMPGWSAFDLGDGEYQISFSPDTLIEPKNDHFFIFIPQSIIENIDLTLSYLRIYDGYTTVQTHYLNLIQTVENTAFLARVSANPDWWLYHDRYNIFLRSVETPSDDYTEVISELENYAIISNEIELSRINTIVADYQMIWDSAFADGQLAGRASCRDDLLCNRYTEGKEDGIFEGRNLCRDDLLCNRLEEGKALGQLEAESGMINVGFFLSIMYGLNAILSIPLWNGMTLGFFIAIPLMLGLLKWLFFTKGK